VDAANDFPQYPPVRICVIFNPFARGQKAEKLARLLKQFIRDCHCKPTSFAGEARRLATIAVSEGFDTIVAAGGDGTVNEVLNGIGDEPHGFSKARLAVLPMGTTNVFARELKVPLKLEHAWEMILRGAEITIDLPQVELMRDGKMVSRYFAQFAGAGLDSSAVENINWELKKKIGALSYIVAGIKALGTKQSRITATFGTQSVTGETVIIGNGGFYGGSLVLFPRADLRDGQLEICMFPKMNWQVAARAGIGLLTNNVHRFYKAREMRAETLTLTADKKTFLQLDGETAGELPARFSILPKKLRVIVP
jgi:YegS/Rv2252/BmrU family lipid kinase